MAATSSNIYQYPLNLGTADSDGSHRVTFQILVPQTTNSNPATGDMVAMYLPPDA